MDIGALEAELLGAFEVHEPEEIRRIIAAGLSPTAPIKGKRPIDCLIEAYLRTDRFPDCLRAMLDAGASTGDPLLEALLLDDESALAPLIESGQALGRRFDILAAFTPAAAFPLSTSAPSSDHCAAPAHCSTPAPM